MCRAFFVAQKYYKSFNSPVNHQVKPHLIDLAPVYNQK
jgi:hypothetical protein